MLGEIAKAIKDEQSKVLEAQKRFGASNSDRDFNALSEHMYAEQVLIQLLLKCKDKI